MRRWVGVSRCPANRPSSRDEGLWACSVCGGVTMAGLYAAFDSQVKAVNRAYSAGVSDDMTIAIDVLT